MKTVYFNPHRFNPHGSPVYFANGDGTITGYDEFGNEITLQCEAPDVCPRPKEPR